MAPAATKRMGLAVGVLVAAAVAAAAAAAGAPAGGNRIPRQAPPAKYNTTSRRVEGAINVHLVAHTHDDVGWLKTVDQYYYGLNNSIQYAAVANILDAVTAELARDANRKFIYVETEFFWRWWQNRPQFWNLTRALVAAGQLEFINGGACMHDEANPSYVDMIDQTTTGHRFLKETFGVAPRATWQIDPFGHSAFQASMMSAPIAGFDSVFYARADYQDFAARVAAKATEYFWAPSPSLGPTSATLGGILFYYYYPPAGWNWGGNDDPIADDPTLEDYNVQARVDDFVATALVQANGTMGADLMWTMGTDFSYEQAVFWYANLDRIIHYVNLDGRVNALYSTPSQYAAAKIGYGAANPLPVRTDDMFPLVDGPHSVWAGYFTSRPALKGYIRDTSSYQHAARQVQALAGGGGTATGLNPANPLYLLERAMGVNQHHDAVSGTSKQAVAYDYALRLAAGRLAANTMLASALANLTADASAAYVTCDLANVTICPALEAGTATVVTVYSGLGQARPSALLRFPVGPPAAGAASYAVYDATGAAVTAQLLPSTPSDTHLRVEYYDYNATPTQWLAFLAALPPMGFTTFFIVPVAAAADAPATHASVVTRLAPLTAAPLRHRKRPAADAAAAAGAAASTLTNGVVSLAFSPATGLITSFTKNGTGTVPFTQTFGWYNASAGVQDTPQIPQNDQASGAYIFRPNSSTVFPVGPTPVGVTFVTGPVVQEARQVFGAWVSQTVRTWGASPYVDFEWTVGPIPFADDLGREVVAQYTTGWDTNGTWWTDSNGRDSMLRLRNKRLSWNITITEPVADNYYPVNAFITTADTVSGAVMSVLVDRSEGGSSMADGEVELMVHRRLQYDDNRGVGEPLNETGLDGNGLIVRGTHRLTIDPPAAAGAARRTALNDMMFRPLPLYTPLTTTVPAWLAAHTPTLTGLSAPLPANLHLLTAHAWGPGTLLLRLAHMYEVGEAGPLSANVTVNLATMFSSFTITSAVETTLTANQPLADAPVTTYVTDDGYTSTLPIVPPAPAGSALAVTLTPMTIRTFMCTTVPAAA